MPANATTTCRCGYASPATLPRCLGCGRRFVRCERAAAPVVPAPAVPHRAARRPTAAPIAGAPRRPEVVAPSAFSGRDAARFGVAPPPAAAALPPVAFGPVAVLGLVAAAWIEPDAPRVEILTAAALLGAGLAAMRPATTPTAAPSAPSITLPTRLTDDELRDALAAW